MPPETPSIGDIKDMMAEISQTALANAHLMETDRPYSSLPPSRHPVWADELRAETAQLREEGLVPAFAWHPWETDPVGWPSQDPVTQADLLADVQERREWEALAAEIRDDPAEILDDRQEVMVDPSWDDPTPWDVTGDHVITAVDMIRDYGHQDREPAEELPLMLEPSQGESLSLRYANALRSLYDLPALSRQETDTSQGMEY